MTWGTLQQGRDREVTAGLLRHPGSHVHEHHQGVGRRRARDGVARVLHVPRAIREDEGAPGGSEVSVRDVDRDALLALGTKPVGQQREVDALAPALASDALDRLVGVGQDGLGVMQQPAHECRLAVVY